MVSSRETRLERGRARGRELTRAALTELRKTRLAEGISQRAMATSLKWSQSRYSEFERDLLEPTVVDIARAAALLGLRPSLALHQDGEPLHDTGQLKLIARFTALLAPAWLVKIEAPFPTLGDLRSWDVLIRLGTAYRAGVEAETRLRDMQRLVRRIRQRELHGGVDHILLVLSDSRYNRPHADELRVALGQHYATPTQTLTGALRAGEPLPGSGVLLL
jgi:transcriptional regulator with XRE-family HTH domain